MVAAAGASVLSAVIVNPLDVVKVRMQAEAANAAVASTARSYHAYCFSIPVRSIQSTSRKFLVGSATTTTLAQHPVLQEMIASCLGRGTASGAAAAGAPSTQCLCAATAGVGALSFPPSEGGYALPVARAAGGSVGTAGQPWQLLWRPAGLAAGDTGSRPAASSGMLGTLQSIMRLEGASSLWRGLDSALLMSVPTVLLYYPLYDHLLGVLSGGGQGPQAAPAPPQQQWSLGVAAPVVAGASARTVTVMAVAPLEYIRTLQQAGGGAVSSSTASSAGAAAQLNTWQALRSSLAGAEAGGTGVWGVLRVLPRLWTGLSATIARDVPFSAVYWGLVEPIRESILSSSRSLAHLAGAGPQAPTVAGTTADARRSLPGRALGSLAHDASGTDAGGMASNHSSVPQCLTAPGQEQDDWVVTAADSPLDGHGAAPTATSGVGGAPQAAAPAVAATGAVAPGLQAQPTHWQLVLANVLAGSLAGAAASALTTPFDVVKTRMQLSSFGADGGASSMLGVMRQVVRQQGVLGLFVGVGPRAARCAPACAIVLFSYELLKRTLADQQQ